MNCFEHKRSEFNSKLWNSTTDDESPARKQVRAQKRKLNFIANIYVIQDQMNPENNGKVFLYKFGKKIYDKLNETMNPQFEDEDPMNPFDFWAGANFKLKIRNVEGYRNYDKSEFSAVSPLFDSDDQMENVWKQQHSLQAFLAPSNFKSYDDLKAKMNKVLGLTGSGGAEPAAARAAVANRKPDPTEDDAPWADPKPLKETPTPAADEDDDDMAFFSKLANK